MSNTPAYSLLRITLKICFILKHLTVQVSTLNTNLSTSFIHFQQPVHKYKFKDFKFVQRAILQKCERGKLSFKETKK